MQPSERSRPSQSRSQERVEKIIIATQKMLAQYGYEETTIKRIAQAAGIKQTSIYRYYPNKRAVCSLLADIFIEEQNKAITHCIEESLRGQPAEKIIHEFNTKLRLGMHQEQWISPVQLALRSDPHLRDRHEEVLDHFAERFSLMLSSFGVTETGESLMRISKSLVLIYDAYMMAIGRAPFETHPKVQEDFETVIHHYITPFINGATKS
tara:strand:+ start:1024 stop:1650 length:627 start_codon:yes stop_codon:yes gene_type:complete